MITTVNHAPIPKAKSPRCKFHFLLFAGLGILVILLRLGYDVKTYLYGSTITFRRLPSEQYDYILHLPRGYYDFGKRPIIIYLHGAGEVGKDVGVLDQWAPYAYLDEKNTQYDFPFIVVSPITPKHGWDSKRVITFLDDFLAENRFRYRIDSERIYLTGLSMGGFGTFRVACDYPDRFAAIVPLAGGGDPELAAKLLNTPTWAFHDQDDDVVAYEHTFKMIEAMKNAGAKEVKLTTLHNSGHNISQPVYSRPDLYQWLLAQNKHQLSVDTPDGKN